MARLKNKVALITGGAFMEPTSMQFFYDLGIPVVNGCGLTEAGTARGRRAAGLGVSGDWRQPEAKIVVANHGPFLRQARPPRLFARRGRRRGRNRNGPTPAPLPSR